MNMHFDNRSSEKGIGAGPSVQLHSQAIDEIRRQTIRQLHGQHAKGMGKRHVPGPQQPHIAHMLPFMEAAKNGYERIVTSVDNLKFLLDKAADTEMTGEEKNLLTEAQGFETKFDEAMDDDFNTADALAAIFELVKFVNSNAKAESSKAFLEALKQEIVTLSDICGLIVDKKAEMLDSDIEALIEERQAARKAKNFARADEIRDELLAKGIVLEDTREGVKWKRA